MLTRLLPLCCLLLACPAQSALQNEVDESGPGGWARAREVVQRTLEQAAGWFGSDSENGFAALWDGLVPKLGEVLRLEERQATLPEHAWLGDDRASGRQAIADLQDEAIDILTASPADGQRLQIRELEAAIDQARREIAELRRQRVSAPRDALWRKTLEDYDADIRQREAEVADYQAKLDRARRDLVEELRRIGLAVTDDQLRFLLATVVGDDLVQMGIAFDNARAITDQLEDLLVASGEDLETARRYYGMYTVLLRLLDRMHERLLDELDDRYLPDIDSIINRTRGLQNRTRMLQQRTPNPVLSANMRAQELTLRAATLYRSYLVEQRRAVVAAQQRLQRDLDIATNTYDTVKVSGDLVRLMRSGEGMLDTVFKLQVPPLRAFESQEMQREFEKLTRRLRAEGGT